MKNIKRIILTAILVGFLLMIIYSEYSFVGFWTDLVVFLSLVIFVLSTFSNKPKPILHSLKITSILAIMGLLIIFLLNPFLLDHLKLRSFLYQRVEGKLFNAYFKPVGSYSGGYGNFWITETPKYFPIIERKVYWNRTVKHDFNNDTFDGRPIDNYEVVKNYISDNVINKTYRND